MSRVVPQSEPVALLRRAAAMLSAVAGDLEDGGDLGTLRGKYVMVLVDLRDDIHEFISRGAGEPSRFGLCRCGHPAEAHVYHRGPCRPGFVCASSCEKYEPDRGAGAADDREET